MALSTYTGLQASVASWLNKSNLTSQIPDFISLAEAQMNRALRIRQMEQRDTASVSAEYSTLPSDFLEAKSLTASDGTTAWDLEPMPSEVISASAAGNYGQTGKPLFWARVATELRFYPVPDATYTVELTYWQQIPPLASNSTNWLLALAPDAYLYGTLLQAAPFLRDAEMLQVWSGGYTSALEALRGMERVQVGRLRTEVSQALGRSSYNINTDV